MIEELDPYMEEQIRALTDEAAEKDKQIGDLNISITENAVGNVLWNWLMIDDYTAIDGLTIRDNTWFNAGEYRIRDLSDVSGYEFSGNTEADAESWSAVRKASAARAK